MQPHKLPTIGVAGVTIPGAVDCIQKINRLSPSAPNIILNQPNFTVMQAALYSADWPRVAAELTQSVEALAKMGADFAIIPANTVHKVIAEVQRVSPIPVINMLEVVAQECSGVRKIGVMGTIWTMSNHLYRETLSDYGVEEVVPTPEEQQIIHAAIFSELIPTGTVSPETLGALLRIVDSLKAQGCDAIVLACTELPLVLNATNCQIKVIDTTEVLAKAALQKAEESTVYYTL